MYRLERYNEVRYTDNASLKDQWIDEGFTLDEAYEVVEVEPNNEESVEVPVSDYAKYNKDVLLDIAKKRGLNIDGSAKKADIIKLLEE